MAAIPLTGLFGWFNILTIICVYPFSVNVPAVEIARPPFQLPAGIRLILFIWFAASFIMMIPSQYCSPGFLYWDSIELRANSSSILSAALSILRTMSSWRLIHTYGVFPPKTMPAAHPVVRYEVKIEGSETWRSVSYICGSKFVTEHDSPPWPYAGVLRFSRLPYLSFYDGLEFMFTPYMDISPSPYLKAAHFTHRHRVAKALFDSSTLAHSFHIHASENDHENKIPAQVPISRTVVTAVRAWLDSVVPVGSEGSRSILGKGELAGTLDCRHVPLRKDGEFDNAQWSRIIRRCIHLETITRQDLEKIQLQAQLASAEGVLLPPPELFCSSSLGFLRLSLIGQHMLNGREIKASTKCNEASYCNESNRARDLRGALTSAHNLKRSQAGSPSDVTEDPMLAFWGRVGLALAESLSAPRPLIFTRGDLQAVLKYVNGWDEASNPVGLPISCQMAYHLIPAIIHPSVCQLHPDSSAVLPDSAFPRAFRSKIRGGGSLN